MSIIDPAMALSARQEACEDEPWDDDDRADGAEHDWLYQRRNGYADICDPWAPEEVERRRRSRIEREERRCAGGEEDSPGAAKSCPTMTEHDIS